MSQKRFAFEAFQPRSARSPPSLALSSEHPDIGLPGRRLYAPSLVGVSFAGGAWLRRSNGNRCLNSLTSKAYRSQGSHRTPPTKGVGRGRAGASIAVEKDRPECAESIFAVDPARLVSHGSQGLEV